jgi:predicted ArsR family transcriptional regulator
MKTHHKILQLLKTRGALTAKTLANELDLTTMGVRQHVQALEASGYVIYKDEKASRGRPTRYWSLTEKSNAHFENRHDELSIQLIDSVIAIFGEDGLNKLIANKEEVSMRAYRLALADRYGIAEKVTMLAKLRSDEGYMATVTHDDNIYWLFENHCPICAAATMHVELCRSELHLFQNLLSDVATVTREEYIVEGARRCAFKVIPF